MKTIITDTGMYPGKISIEDRVFRPGMNVHPCTGCFSCWVHTPGVCVQKDDAQNMGYLLSKCDELIIVSKCFHGSFSPFVKMLIDRQLPYVRPNFEIRDDRMRHVKRYSNAVQLHIYFYGKDITDAEKELARKSAQAYAVNMSMKEPIVEWYTDAWALQGGEE